MPMSGAGLVRYYDSESSGRKIKPEHVVAFSVVVIGLELAVKLLL